MGAWKKPSISYWHFCGDDWRNVTKILSPLIMICKIPKVFPVEFMLLFMKFIPKVDKKIRFGAMIFIFHQNAKENWQNVTKIVSPGNRKNGIAIDRGQI